MGYPAFDKHNSTQSEAWDIDSFGAYVDGASSSVASEKGFHASHRFRGWGRCMPIWGLRVLRGEGSNHLMGVADRVWWFGSVIMIRLLPPTFASSVCTCECYCETSLRCSNN